jgi:hypothetical protein
MRTKFGLLCERHILCRSVLASYWSAGSETFLQALGLSSHWLQTVRHETAPNNLSETLVASQSAFIFGK